MAFTYQQLLDGITTAEKIIQVELPLGEHHLELVVEDSAGLRSGPDSVVIRVVRPTIGGIDPPSLPQGASQQVVVSGTDLETATGVEFEAEGVTVESIEDAQNQELTLHLSIAPDAATGTRGFNVVFPGEGQSEVQIASGSVTLEITEAVSEPKIDTIDPTSGSPGSVVEMIVQGQGFFRPDNLEFLFEDSHVVDSEITATITSISKTGTRLSAEISITKNATSGDRLVRLTTPLGTAIGPKAFHVIKIGPA